MSHKLKLSPCIIILPVLVMLSVTTLDRKLQGLMEPRTSTPRKRLEAIRKLSEAGIPTSVNVAPVIPGLTDHEMPAILAAAAEAGASSAAYIMLRLPLGVAPLFEQWLEQHFPDRKKKVLSRKLAFSLTVSTHSVVSRRVIQGFPIQYASF